MGALSLESRLYVYLRTASGCFLICRIMKFLLASEGDVCVYVVGTRTGVLFDARMELKDLLYR